MPELAGLAAAAAAGLGLGGVHYGGLWVTVRRLATARRPAALLLLSLALRLGGTAGGFLLVAGGRWERLAACLAGFLAARALAVGRARPGRAPRHAARG